MLWLFIVSLWGNLHVTIFVVVAIILLVLAQIFLIKKQMIGNIARHYIPALKITLLAIMAAQLVFLISTYNEDLSLYEGQPNFFERLTAYYEMPVSQASWIIALIFLSLLTQFLHILWRRAENLFNSLNVAFFSVAIIVLFWYTGFSVGRMKREMNMLEEVEKEGIASQISKFDVFSVLLKSGTKEFTEARVDSIMSGLDIRNIRQILYELLQDEMLYINSNYRYQIVIREDQD